MLIFNQRGAIKKPFVGVPVEQKSKKAIETKQFGLTRCD
jgi:hypothetical protein